MASTVSWRVPKRRLFSVPVPEETRTYKPVSHKVLAKTTLDAIKNAGFSLVSQEYTTARDGLVANARYMIDLQDSEMALEIAWQNSYDKTLSLKFAIGTRIFICENGCVSGDFGAFKRKHMSDVKDFAPEQIEEILKDARESFNQMVSERAAMKAINVDLNKRAEIIGRLFFETNIIGSTQLNIIKNEFNNPTHHYGASGSLWEAYQYVTYSMKHIHPRLWMENHIAVHNFFMNYVKYENGRAPESIEVVDPQQIDLEDMIIEMETEHLAEDLEESEKGQEDGSSI